MQLGVTRASASLNCEWVERAQGIEVSCARAFFKCCTTVWCCCRMRRGQAWRLCVCARPSCDVVWCARRSPKVVMVADRRCSLLCPGSCEDPESLVHICCLLWAFSFREYLTNCLAVAVATDPLKEPLEPNDFQVHCEGWTDGWVGGWVDGWMVLSACVKVKVFCCCRWLGCVFRMNASQGSLLGGADVQAGATLRAM